MTAELGARRISDTNYAGIEAALRWAPGSVERILAGRGDPEPLESAAEETSIDHTLGSRILAEMGGHARVVEILATEMAGESVAVAHVKHGAAVTVEIRLRYASRWQPLKIGDAVEYECRLVSEPLPSGGRERTPCRCGEPGRLHG